jgi:Ca2+-binding RTX toxin-like protein
MPLRIYADEDWPAAANFLPTSGEWSAFGSNPAVVSHPGRGTVTLGEPYRSMSTSVLYTPARDVYGTDSFQYSVTDGLNTATATVLVVIRGHPDAPTFLTLSLPPASWGTPYSHTIQAGDVDGDALTIVAATLPSWITLVDNGDGTATLSGTPTDPAVTSYPIVLRVNDGDPWYWAETSFTLGVHVPPVFAGAPPAATAFFDTTYSHTITAADSNGDPLAITALGLPGWLKLVDHGNGTATLSGTPTDSIASSHAITLRVGDGEFVTEESFAISVPMERFRLDEHGTLTVMGGIGRDVIQVWVREGSQLRAVVNGTIRNFPLSSVTGLTIYGLDDNDSISVNTRTIPAYVLGGGGNDTLTGGDQRDFFIGGGGHDRLFGSGGDDRLSGLAGNDYMEGGSGQDVLTGGDGHDYLIGQSGMDRLYGDNGNDTLLAKDKGYDILHGGDGDDSATWDPNDLLHELFATSA